MALDHSGRSPDKDFYLVLKEFRDGAAFRETDEGIDYAALIMDLLAGEYDQVLRVVVFNRVEGWSRDESEDVARDLERHIAAQGDDVSVGLRGSVEGHLGRAIGAQRACDAVRVLEPFDLGPSRCSGY